MPGALQSNSSKLGYTFHFLYNFFISVGVLFCPICKVLYGRQPMRTPRVNIADRTRSACGKLVHQVNNRHTDARSQHWVIYAVTLPARARIWDSMRRGEICKSALKQKSARATLLLFSLSTHIYGLASGSITCAEGSKNRNLSTLMMHHHAKEKKKSTSSA